MGNSVPPEDSCARADVQHSGAAGAHGLLNGLLVLPVTLVVVQHQEVPALHQPVGHPVEVLLGFRIVRFELQRFVEVPCSFISEAHSERIRGGRENRGGFCNVKHNDTFS